MEILKKVKVGDVWFAWVTLDETDAKLILYDKDDAKTLKNAERLHLVQDELKALRIKYNVKEQ